MFSLFYACIYICAYIGVVTIVTDTDVPKKEGGEDYWKERKYVTESLRSVEKRKYD